MQSVAFYKKFSILHHVSDNVLFENSCMNPSPTMKLSL